MSILAFQKVWTLVPIPIICHIGALFKEIEIKVGRSSEILLSVRVVAFTPFVLFVYIWTKACLVRINHKFFETHGLFILIEVT
jgi:hypothetical protein